MATSAVRADAPECLTELRCSARALLAIGEATGLGGAEKREPDRACRCSARHTSAAGATSLSGSTEAASTSHSYATPTRECGRPALPSSPPSPSAGPAAEEALMLLPRAPNGVLLRLPRPIALSDT